MQFEKHGGSLEKTKLKLLEAANLVDKVTSDMKHETHKLTLKSVTPIFSSNSSCPHPQYYKALKIRVALIGLEVWTSQDMINVSDNPHSTLASFLSWRRKQLHALPNDNAQLITSVTLSHLQLVLPFVIRHPVPLSPLNLLSRGEHLSIDFMFTV